ncbi:MAG: hypothetical protein AB8G11_26145, partial [Saprospiraceae bacterium]
QDTEQLRNIYQNSIFQIIYQYKFIGLNYPVQSCKSCQKILIMVNIETFIQKKVEADTSYNFQKLYAPFWFIVYYIIGYPLRILGWFADGFVIYG